MAFRCFPTFIGLSCLLLSLFGQSGSLAYTGGPSRVHVEGYDSSEGKLFYVVQTESESDEPDEAFYFFLKGSSPAKAIRAKSLESPTNETTPPEVALRWKELRKRLLPLKPLPQGRFVAIEVEQASKPKGRGPTWNVRQFDLAIKISLENCGAESDILTFCGSVVRIKSAYTIPGRAEILVVLAYTGIAYGCEEVETPLILLCKDATPT
jgi:hypothetical protein